jgi:hypothetical protein
MISTMLDCFMSLNKKYKQSNLIPVKVLMEIWPDEQLVTLKTVKYYFVLGILLDLFNC